MFRNLPIRRKMMAMLLMTSGAVLLLTCLSFVVYEFVSFRQSMARNIATLAQVIANNSTAALAFDNQEDAKEILQALKAEPHIVAAALYDGDGLLFATYPADLPASAFPQAVAADGYRFQDSHLIGVEPISQGNNKRLGTLYVKADEEALYTQLRLYTLIAAVMAAILFLIAYLLSRILQRQISAPVMRLAQTASAVSDRHDYSVRAQKFGDDELGRLTDAFNHMLAQIQEQDRGVRESETRLRAVLNSALSAVVVIDSDSKILDWNPCAEQIFGWSREEALGRDLTATIIPPQYQQQHRRGMQKFLLSGEGTVLNRLVELSARRRDGSEFPVELSVSPLQSGARTTFCGFVTDITERKLAQARMQVQLGKLYLLQRITRAIGERQDLSSIFQVVIRSVEDNLPLDFGCICLYSAAENKLTVTSIGVRSRALAMELAMTEQANVPIDQNGLSRCVQGQLVYEADISQVAFPFPRRLAGSGLRSLVVAPLLAESQVFGVLVAARRTVNGFSSSDCEFLLQLSEHVALASHQAQLYTALQKAYEELRQSQHAILQQERLRALGQMASGVAHDINNAISPIALYTESLLEREPGLSERARNYLATIQRAIEDVARTVSRMREFYRPREQQITLMRIDMNNIAMQVIELTRVRWRDVPQERGIVIDLKTEFAADLPKVMGADNEIRDAMTNLMFNAVDAMPEGGTLTVRTYAVKRPENEDQAAHESVVLEVADTGIGMDDETRQRCLEPFYTTKGERGTGLGLAMVYGMVQRHSSELQIDSVVGQGTTMRLVFTAVPASSTGAELQAILHPAAASHILIIDDDPLILESLRDILQRDGHKVAAADGGQAGIDAFTEAQRSGSKFDVVITDLGMPYVDGRRVATAIKTASPTTPVILLTGWGHRLKSENDIPANVDCVLNKPPKLIELRRALTDHLPDKHN